MNLPGMRRAMRDEYEERPRRRPARPPEDEGIEEHPRRRPARREDAEYSERPLRRRPPRDEDEDDDRESRPRKKKRRARFAECPHCGCPGRADRVSFTWWGGMVGPILLSHVRCRECGWCYNGKTGSDNRLNILLYIVIPLVVLVVAAVVVTLNR
jgi:hypothetical protein